MEILDELEAQAELYRDPNKTVPSMSELERFLSLLSRFMYDVIATARKEEREWAGRESAILRNAQSGLLSSARKYYVLRSHASDYTPQEMVILKKMNTLHNQIARLVGREPDPTAGASPPPAAPSPEDPTQS